MADININSIHSGLIESARLVMTEMVSRTSNGQYPHELPGSISVGSPEPLGKDKIKITIKISHPAAPAFEFGSGIHGESGRPYEIKPRNAQALNIPFSKWENFTFPLVAGKKMIGYNESGEGALLRYVEHPGIEAKPFARPSLEATKDEIKSKLRRSFIAAIGTGKREKIKIEVTV